MNDSDAAPTPPAVYPRMFYLPGVLKHWDAGFYASAFRSALSALSQREPARLIDAHFVWPDGVGAWRVAQETGLPFVCTLRGKLASQIASRPKRKQIVSMLAGADALIAVSQALSDHANRIVGKDLGVRVIPNGIDGRLFHRTANEATGAPDPAARAALGWSDGASYVVSVGHWTQRKGFHRLVEIWPDVRRRSGDVRLILVGGEVGAPGYARRLRRQVARLNRPGPTSAADEPVVLLGSQPPRVIARLLNAADLFVLATYMEGCCNAIAEALACGCPVVATDVGGNRELVNDDRLGRLVPLDDGRVLADAVCSALARNWDRRRIAETGGQRDWQQAARECVDVFESLW